MPNKTHPMHGTKANLPKGNAIRPAHYQTGGVEVIDYLRAKLTPEEFLGFCKGNALKYLSRANEKGGLEDLKKAAWYTSLASGVDPRKKK